MKAIYDFKSIDDINHAIVEAEDIFQDYYIQKWTKYQRNIENWVNDKVSKDWYKRPYEYWRKRLESSHLDSYLERNSLKPSGMDWVKDKIERCDELKKKLTIHPKPDQIILSDDEIALLTISAKSAKEATQEND